MADRMTFGDMAALFHSSFFAFEQAHGRITGTASRAILQQIVRVMPKILEKEGQPVINKSLTLEENMAHFRDYIHNEELIENVNFENNDDMFNIEIKGCTVAKSGVHEILDPKKSTCPYAIVAAAMIFYLTGKNLTIEDSEFTKDGTKTLLKLHHY
ncbi:MAG TPA: hypothetical protein HA257_04340 [Candidatus Methanoperedenaceae archaeon]|nr:hypothetical protein [Candidatus Methanoperedenaceae archaeon]